MKAAIMAGGFGTRLRPLTSSIPKPMTPMVNCPMMDHIVRLLKGLGIAVLSSVISMLVVWYAFKVLLGVQLPAGPLEGIL